jgi:hypothetical protein
MDSPGVQILLGAIALSSIVQAVVLIGVAWGGLQFMRRFQALQVRVEREIAPVVESLGTVSRNVAEVSELAVVQVRRVEAVVEDTLTRVDEARAQVHRVFRRPRGIFGDAAALVKGVKRGLAVYQRLGGLQAQARGKARSYAGDEHLFI